MVTIVRDIYYQGKKVGQMQVAFDLDGAHIVIHSDAVERRDIHLTHTEADVLYDLMTLTIPTYKEDMNR